MLITLNPLNANIKIQILINILLSLYIFIRSSGENLLQSTIDSSSLIMSTILI